MFELFAHVIIQKSKRFVCVWSMDDNTSQNSNLKSDSNPATVKRLNQSRDQSISWHKRVVVHKIPKQDGSRFVVSTPFFLCQSKKQNKTIIAHTFLFSFIFFCCDWACVWKLKDKKSTRQQGTIRIKKVLQYFIELTQQERPFKNSTPYISMNLQTRTFSSKKLWIQRDKS